MHQERKPPSSEFWYCHTPKSNKCKISQRRKYSHESLIGIYIYLKYINIHPCILIIMINISSMKKSMFSKSTTFFPDPEMEYIK